MTAHVFKESAPGINQVVESISVETEVKVVIIEHCLLADLDYQSLEREGLRAGHSNHGQMV